MSATTVNTYMSAGITAMRADDWATAYVEFLSAKAELAGMADTELDGTKLTWNRESIDSLIAKAEAKAASVTAHSAAPGGFVRVPIRYAEPTS